MSRRIDAATLLERALMGDAERSRVSALVTAATSTRWASATFVGARHRLTIEGDGGAAALAWLGQLAEADLPLRGHLVADLTVLDHADTDDRFTATIEALTVEEA